MKLEAGITSGEYLCMTAADIRIACLLEEIIVMVQGITYMWLHLKL